MDTSDMIRNHLKTLTVEDIANSTWLYGIDFDNDPMDKIFEALSLLCNNVKTLSEMIDRDFEPIDDEKMPKDAVTKSLVVKDYCCKKDALVKALNNKVVYAAFENYMKEHEEKEKEPTK